MTESEFISTFEDFMNDHIEVLREVSLECNTPDKMLTIIESFKESVDAIRTILKYMQLDIEATRREACTNRSSLEN